jgi:hypothetical protein
VSATARYAYQATYFRTGLLLGLVRGDVVHRWADEVIASEPDPPSAFIEIASVPVDDLSNLRHALWPLVVDPEPRAVLGALFQLLSGDLDAGRRSFADTLTVVRQMRSMVRLPADLYAGLSAALVEYGQSRQRAVIAGWLRSVAS